MTLLTSCSKSGGVDISDSERIDLSYMIETDLPCINGNDIYDIEEYQVDFGSLGIQEEPNAFDGERVYFFSRGYGLGLENERDALIMSYNLKTGEKAELYREKAAEERELAYLYMGIDQGVLYWLAAEEYTDFLGYYKNDGARLFGYDIEKNTAEELCSINKENMWYTEFTAKTENKLYFEVHKLNSYSEYIKSAVYCYDTHTRQAYEVIDYGANPQSYKNGIVYEHDGAVYYRGPDKVPNTGVFYENDVLVYDPAADDSMMQDFRIFSSGDRLLYSYCTYSSYTKDVTEGNVYLSTDHFTIGELDGKFRRRDFASAAAGYSDYGFLDDGKSADGLVCFTEFINYLIYDIEGGFFASLTLDFPPAIDITDEAYALINIIPTPIVNALTCGDSILLYGTDCDPYGQTVFSEKAFAVRKPK